MLWPGTWNLLCQVRMVLPQPGEHFLSEGVHLLQERFHLRIGDLTGSVVGSSGALAATHVEVVRIVLSCRAHNFPEGLEGVEMMSCAMGLVATGLEGDGGQLQRCFVGDGEASIRRDILHRCVGEIAIDHTEKVRDLPG